MIPSPHFFSCRACPRRYRKSDLTFSEPLGNHLNLYQLELNPDDRLVFNFRAPQYDDVLLNEGGEATALLKDKVLPEATGTRAEIGSNW